MRKLKKRVILAGKAASGKDFLRNEFTLHGYKPDISVTTRPPRLGEKDGDAYHFIDESYFNKLVDDDMLYEHIRFNGWGYGTLRKSWNESDVFIMTPSGIKHILPEERTECVILYIDVDEETRRNRLSLRSDSDSVERRLEADEKDFADFNDYDLCITNPNFSTLNIMNLLINSYVKKEVQHWR